MAPFYRGWEPNLQLNRDDIEAIQSLYGKMSDSIDIPSSEATTSTTTTTTTTEASSGVAPSSGPETPSTGDSDIMRSDLKLIRSRQDKTFQIDIL
jgi:hypothetical protein